MAWLHKQTTSISRPLFAGLFRSILGLSLGLVLFISTVTSVAGGAPQTILIGVDGLSYTAFVAAQKAGLFQEFGNVGAHVAPFPSMTDLSWSTVTHTAELFGAAGRIKSVEATYFDESTSSIQGDPRDYYRRLAFPKYYMGAFENFFNPYVEGLMYFPSEEVPKLEIKSVIDDLISAKQKPLLTGYIGAADSISHTQRDRLFPLLKILDSELKRLIASFRERGQEVEVILLSDHGNIGRFHETGAEQELLGVDIEKSVKNAGFEWVQQLKSDQDIAMPLLALGNWGPIYLKDRKKIPAVVEAFRNEEWFDLAVTINKNSISDTVMTVYSKDGEAKVQFDKIKNTYSYRPLVGNPLGIAKQFHSKDLSSKDIFQISVGTPYPDAIYRLIEAASERNFDFPDLVLSLADGYYLKSALGAFAKMYRTHGSLSAASTFGLVASTKRKVPGQIRSKDIFAYFGIEAKNLFGDTLSKHQATGGLALAEVYKNSSKGIETDARNFDQKRVFRHITKFVADTRPFFVVSEMRSFMDAFHFDPFKTNSSQNMLTTNFDISKFDVTSMISSEDVGHITDAVLTSGSLENLLEDPRIRAIQKRVGLLQNTRTAQIEVQHIDLNSGGGVLEDMRSYLLPAKRAAMKMYQMPFLLESSFVFQEKAFLPESRDLQFARRWVSAGKELSTSYAGLTKTLAANSQSTKLSVAQKLLVEATEEADLEGRIYPSQLTMIYNKKFEDLTIVYMPGIYNGIFDKEIFALGLSALSDEMGLRVIQPPVESTCSSLYNAEIIKSFLQKDLKDRQARGHKVPRYLFLSYSKGAVDTLEFFVNNRSFTANFVKGMVAIAAPLHGSSILNTTDLPFALVNALSEDNGPAICQKDQPASKSVVPTALDAFWRKNERSLLGLTRYFSVTFASTPENSHIFMKATKLIGQFDEDNDGVVTVSSSKFPESLHAVDLGTIAADHLAGVLSSRFNQKAFIKGLIRTLAELQVEDDVKNLVWNTEAVLAVANQNAFRQGIYYRAKAPGLVQKLSLKGTPRLSKMFDVEPFSNALELNNQILLPINDPADHYEPSIRLPPSQLRYDPYAVLNVQKLPDLMAGLRVTPATKQNMPKGILMEYHHKNMVHFRMDHQLNYESRSPIGNDDNQEYGFITADFNGEKDWVLMRSKNNSIRLTTLAYRFSPLEFPKMSLKMAVTKDVLGADPVKGKTGKDDSSFQVWFTIRDGKTNGDRAVLDPKNDKVFLFGYYYAGPVPGESRPQGAIFENWYSNKNIVVATLPEAKEVLLNSADMLGKAQVYNRNLAEDLKKAFPDRKVGDMDIVAITIQHDSNDTKDSSEAYFKSLGFAPL